MRSEGEGEAGREGTGEEVQRQEVGEEEGEVEQRLRERHRDRDPLSSLAVSIGCSWILGVQVPVNLSPRQQSSTCSLSIAPLANSIRPPLLSTSTYHIPVRSWSCTSTRRFETPYLSSSSSCQSSCHPPFGPFLNHYFPASATTHDASSSIDWRLEQEKEGAVNSANFGLVQL